MERKKLFNEPLSEGRGSGGLIQVGAFGLQTSSGSPSISLN